jgi:hypothetical protein
MNYPVSFTRQLMELRLNTKRGAYGLAVAGLCLVPSVALTNNRIGRMLVSVAGITCAVVGNRQLEDSFDLDAISNDLYVVDRKQTIHWYNGLMNRSEIAPVSGAGDAIGDVVDYWLTQDKHLLVIGGTGSGKSYFIQAFANRLGEAWKYKLYDNDCTIDDWLKVRGMPESKLYESYGSIAESMAEDLVLLEERTKERKKQGNTWVEQAILTVAEEMPSLVDEIEITSDWIGKIAKRGRRVKQYLAVVAQNDTVKNLGLVGDSKLRDSCFVRVYLGQSAIERASLLKQPLTVEWLRQGGKDVCLVDDLTAIRPKL